MKLRLLSKIFPASQSIWHQVSRFDTKARDPSSATTACFHNDNANEGNGDGLRMGGRCSTRPRTVRTLAVPVRSRTQRGSSACRPDVCASGHAPGLGTAAAMKLRSGSASQECGGLLALEANSATEAAAKCQLTAPAARGLLMNEAG